MSEFWLGAMSGIVGWIALMWLLKQLLVMLVLKLAAKEIKKMKEEGDDILLKVEEHSGQYYCFRKDNDEFIGQGATLQEVADIFKKKYPNNNGRILKEDQVGA
jgi:hypothetical protein